VEASSLLGDIRSDPSRLIGLLGARLYR
jgi:hypothetical protein